MICLFLFLTLLHWIELFVCVSFCLFFRATPVAYGGSQATGLIRAVAASLRHSHTHTGSIPVSAAYTTAHSNAASLTF